VSLDALTARRAAALPEAENELSRRYLRVLEKWVRVGLSYFDDWPLRPECGHFLGGCHWYGIETISGALTFALAASSPELDEAATGCSREEMRRVALKAVRYLAFTHDAGPADCVRPAQGLGRPENFGRKWGERGRGFFPESQCGTTIAGMSMTALLLGPLADDETWSLLAAVLEDYAGRFGQMPPRNGVYADTQMEENGWTSCGLSAAALFLERHPAAAAWAENARRWMFCTAAAPQDARNSGAFEQGRTVAQCAARTFTALPDYMAENHGFVHPNYTSSSIHFTGYLASLHRLVDAPLPPHALFNRQRIYDQLKLMTESHGYMHAVQGMDWPYLWPDPFTMVHATAAVVLKDPDAAAHERRALAALEARQAANQGRMYDPEIAEKCHDIQDPMIVRECTIEGPARTYLLHRLLGPGPKPTPEADLRPRLRGVRVFPHAGFVFHRHDRGQTSFSWRNVIMALPLNSDGLYTVAPATGTLLARIQVRDLPDSHDLVSLRVEDHPDAFAAALVMDRHQAAIRQEVLFASLPDGKVLLRERLVAQRELTVESLDQGFLRIINERFRGPEEPDAGSRTIHTPSGSEVFRGFVSTDPADDIVRTWKDIDRLNVDDRLGLVFRGTGQTVYHNRHYFKPWWAVTDDLILSRRETPFQARQGEVMAEFACLAAPDQPHAKTARQDLAILRSPSGALALMADGCLAVANMGLGPQIVALVAERNDADPTPLFEGVVRFGPRQVRHSLPMRRGEARLLCSPLAVRVKGKIEIAVCADGRALARNLDRETARVHLAASKRSVSLRPGQVAELRV